jgi:putative tryptophan/tyrosine transport system substrate-binding protein
VPLAAMRATSTIPIVFMIGTDPVEAGLVKSFNRPEGNVTGVTLLTTMMEPKRLGLLHELAPGADLIGVLMNPNFPEGVRQLPGLKEAARTIGRQLVIANASHDEELDAAFVSLVQEHVGALLVGADPYFNTRRDRIVAFAARLRLPAIYQFREYAVAGGLMSYGINLTDAYRQCGEVPQPVVSKCSKRRAPIRRYSMTSSASERRLSEISMLSTFAVLRLITSSNLVGCRTGSSAGLAPLRTFAV